MLETKNGFYTWTKGDACRLSDHFETWEFECQCKRPNCGPQKASVALVTKLERIRSSLGSLLFVTSGFRCTDHQADLRKSGLETAAGVSQHELGNAVDIKHKNMKKLLAECEKEFKAVGVANTFIHVDERADKPRRWSYVK